ncbi:MAG: ABC transporter ATP-binding protein, partial [Halodesulfurarchaeum sp.]
MDESTPILDVSDLKTHFPVTEGFLKREQGRIRAVDGISFSLRQGEILGLVGESGAGKSTVARTLLGLETPSAGSIEFDGTRLDEMDASETRAFRRRVQMVFQDTDSSFDPRMTVGEAIQEPMMAHGLTDQSVLVERTALLLESVGLSGEFSQRYPHQLSGGEKQRAALARALGLGPDVLLLDEPVSALDVSVQARIIHLIQRLQREYDLSIVLITHDMTVVKELCTRIAVMYLGEIVELGPTQVIFSNPRHPYTAGLIEAIPEPDPTQGDPAMRLKGSIQDPSDPPPGCRFHTRCPEVIQPPEIDLPQAVFRSIYDLLVALREGTFSMDSVRGGEETGSGLGPSPSTEGPSESRPDSAGEAIRQAYDIPGELSDAEAERSMSRAIDRIVAGDMKEAEDILADVFA